jgi:hypothetical protein
VFHDKSIWLDDTAVAVKPVGADGAVGDVPRVVAEATLLAPESPAELTAKTS